MYIRTEINLQDYETYGFDRNGFTYFSEENCIKPEEQKTCTMVGKTMKSTTCTCEYIHPTPRPAINVSFQYTRARGGNEC